MVFMNVAVARIKSPATVRTPVEVDCKRYQSQPLAAIAVTSTRMPSTASEATPTAARTGHGLAKKRW